MTDRPCIRLGPALVDGSMDKLSRDYKMRRESVRIESFVGWPIPFLSFAKLARAGFFYNGTGDKVQCAFCNIQISGWQFGHDPFKIHKAQNRECHYVKGIDYGIPFFQLTKSNKRGGHLYYSAPFFQC